MCASQRVRDFFRRARVRVVVLCAGCVLLGAANAHGQGPDSTYAAAAAEDRAAADGRGADQMGNPEYLSRTAVPVSEYFASGDESILHDPFRTDWNGTRGEIREVTFKNRYGATLVGRLYRANGFDGRLPAVVFTPGAAFQNAEAGPGYTYEPLLEQIAEAGYLVFEFEPQGQGGSELEPNPREEFCGPHAGAWWRQPQELGLRETNECAGYDSPEMSRPGTPLADAVYDAMGPLADTPLGAVLTPIALLEYSAEARQGEFEVDRVAAGYEHFRNRFVFGALDAVAWLTSDANPWRGRVDAHSIGFVGHSAGADAAVLAGNGDPQQRIDAVVAWDSYGRPPVSMPARVPTMLQQSEQQVIVGPWIPKPDPEMWISHSIADEFRAAGVPSSVITLRGSTHSEWAYVPYALVNPVAPLANSSSLGGQVGVYYTVAWLDRFLREDPAAEERLFAAEFDGSTDASSIGSGTWNPVNRSNVPYRIEGRRPSELLSRTFHSNISLGGRSCLNLQGGCPNNGGEGPQPKEALAVQVRPRTLVAGRLTRVRTRVRQDGRPVRGAHVKLGSQTKRTSRRGFARLRVQFAEPGIRRLRVTKKGAIPELVRIRVVRRGA